jgi:hypothetical protein
MIVVVSITFDDLLSLYNYIYSNKVVVSITNVDNYQLLSYLLQLTI